MSNPGLDVSKSNDVSIVTFGDAHVLDIATSQTMAKTLLRLADAPPAPKILIDFSDVRLIASRMLGLLVELTKRAEVGKGKVVVCGLCPDVGRIFKVMRLDKLLTVASDRQQGMTLLAPGGQG